MAPKRVRHDRKTKGSWTTDDLQEALQKVHSGSMKICKAADKYHISRRTLLDRLKRFNPDDGTFDVSSKYKGKPMLDKEQENLIEGAIGMLDSVGIFTTRRDVKSICFEYCESAGIKTQFNKKTRLASDKWFDGFVRRHPAAKIGDATKNADGALEPFVAVRSAAAKRNANGPQQRRPKRMDRCPDKAIFRRALDFINEDVDSENDDDNNNKDENEDDISSSEDDDEDEDDITDSEDSDDEDEEMDDDEDEPEMGKHVKKNVKPIDGEDDRAFEGQESEEEEERLDDQEEGTEEGDEPESDEEQEETAEDEEDEDEKTEDEKTEDDEEDEDDINMVYARCSRTGEIVYRTRRDTDQITRLFGFKWFDPNLKPCGTSIGYTKHDVRDAAARRITRCRQSLLDGETSSCSYKDQLEDGWLCFPPKAYSLGILCVGSYTARKIKFFIRRHIKAICVFKPRQTRFLGKHFLRLHEKLMECRRFFDPKTRSTLLSRNRLFQH